MAFPFVFGDSYGGVQAAQQADVNSDRSFTAQLIAAQQQAQKMAIDQSNVQTTLNQKLQDQALERAQRAEQFQALIDQREQDRALKEDLGIAGLDTAEYRIKSLEDQFYKKLSQAHDDRIEEVKGSGPVLASEFSKTIQANKSAEEALAAANSQYLQVEQDIEAKKAQGWLRKDPKDPNRVIATGENTDDTMKASAEKLNDARRQATAAINEAKREKAQAEHDFQTQMRLVTSSGFLPSEQGIVHRKTGTVFPFQFGPPPNSPQIRPAGLQIRTYDPRLGLSGGTPGASVAQVAKPPAPDNSLGWGMNFGFKF